VQRFASGDRWSGPKENAFSGSEWKTQVKLRPELPCRPTCGCICVVKCCIRPYLIYIHTIRVRIRTKCVCDTKVHFNWERSEMKGNLPFKALQWSAAFAATAWQPCKWIIRARTRESCEEEKRECSQFSAYQKKKQKPKTLAANLELISV